MLAALLLINSANGYYNILWYGKDAKKATKDVLFAGMDVPCLLFIHVGLAMVTGGVLPHDESCRSTDNLTGSAGNPSWCSI